MSIKDLFLIFSKKDYEKELKIKITALEMNIEELKKTLAVIQKKEEAMIPEPKEPPIIIEKVNIEKIILDKYELNNNFGQLGIKELKGKLNIGATYGSEFIPETNRKEKKENCSADNIKKTETGKGPKVTIQAKREKKD